MKAQRLIVAEAARKTKAARLALQRTRAALADARRARSSGKPTIEEDRPTALPGASGTNKSGDRQALPYLVEEMPR